MEYSIFENLITIKLSNFINEYKNASKLFENTNVRNRLLHPGEYGMYKEKLIANLFEFVLPKKYSYGTGFITNNNKEITSQCDIVLYDQKNAPFMEMNNNTRFFPQEVIYGIGEVKSKLTKNQLFDALIKLAENKKIRKPFSGITKNDEVVEVNPEKYQYQSICTFLICDEIIGWDNNISLDIRNMYNHNNIIPQYQFNIILSLTNGVIAYDIKKASDELKKYHIDVDEALDKNNGHLNFASSFFRGAGLQNIVELDYYTLYGRDEITFLKQFMVLLNDFLVHLNSYYPDPAYYLY